jgi:syntaxin 16
VKFNLCAACVDVFGDIKLLAQCVVMATRDRTALFLRYREEANAIHDVPRRRTGAAGNGHGGDEEDPRPLLGEASCRGPLKRTRLLAQAPEPNWVSVYRDLVDDIAEVDNLLGQLRGLHARHLLPSFGKGDGATVTLETEITTAAKELSTALHAAERKMRLLGGPEDDEEVVVRRNVQKRFAAQLQDQSMNFRLKQKEYLSELRGQRDGTGETGPGIGLTSLARGGSIDVRAGSMRHSISDSENYVALAEEDDELDDYDAQQHVRDLRGGERLAAERNREIAKIAASINDLATIVKDLAGLVVDQGTVLDRVDYNVEEVRSTTKAAVRQLRIADRYQRKRHAFWCIVILALGCAIMAVCLLMKWTSS